MTSIINKFAESVKTRPGRNKQISVEGDDEHLQRRVANPLTGLDGGFVCCLWCDGVLIYITLMVCKNTMTVLLQAGSTSESHSAANIHRNILSSVFYVLCF